jgi:signal transduction histidine kinase
MTSSGPRFLSHAHYGPKPERPPLGAMRQRAADDAKRSFLRMVSHELRTPLNSIIGFSEIISCELYGPLSEPRYREHAEIIRESGHRMLKLVNQVMEIARLESGAADLDIRAEAPRGAVDEVVLSLAPEAAARNVTLRVEALEATPPVLADARGLRTILANLIQNAIAFSPEGGDVVIGLRVRRDDIAIEVRDHGPGIPLKDVARVMQPFEHVESALTRHGHGAGLGLPIVKLLCDAMSAQLRLLPAPNGGLIASVRLPMGQAAEDEAA